MTFLFEQGGNMKRTGHLSTRNMREVREKGENFSITFYDREEYEATGRLTITGRLNGESKDFHFLLIREIHRPAMETLLGLQLPVRGRFVVKDNYVSWVTERGQ